MTFMRVSERGLAVAVEACEETVKVEAVPEGTDTDPSRYRASGTRANVHSSDRQRYYSYCSFRAPVSSQGGLRESVL